MSHVDDIRNALVDLRAIARGNDMEVRMSVARAERYAPVHVDVWVGSRTGGLLAELRRGGDAVTLLHGIIRSYERCGVTARLYEGATYWVAPRWWLAERDYAQVKRDVRPIPKRGERSA